MIGLLIALASTLPFALLWWVLFARHAPQPSDTATVAARRLRALQEPR